MMTTQKPIRTEAEYDEALAELDRVWEAKMHTPEGDLKEVLVLLIDDYENKHHSILPLSPLEAIKFR